MPHSVGSIDADQRALYERIAADEFVSGPHGLIVFVVSTRSLEEGRGDLFVALGLAKYLIREGWGVSLWPMSEWGGEVDSSASVVIVMLESFVPGLLPASAVRVAWVRNWTDSWMALPYLDAFDEIWTSSSHAAKALEENTGREVRVVPIAADLELFHAVPAPTRFDLVTTVNDWGGRREIDRVIEGLPDGVVVHWFGHSSQSSRSGRVVHGGPVSYFSLPDIYAGSTLVIDDVIAPAAKYGMHNSRLFEAIAAGSLPITNTELGLDELGLAQIPRYTDAASLVTVIARMQASPTDRQRLLEHARAVVAERHSFELRAKQVSPMLEAAVSRLGQRSERSRMLAWAARQRAELIGGQVHARVVDRELVLARTERDRLHHLADLRAEEIERMHEHLDVLRDEVAHPIRRRLGRLRARMLRRIGKTPT